MPTVKLTRSTINKLPELEKSVTYYDHSLRGFGLKVLASGQRRWIVEYRPNGGGRSTAKRRLVIGPCPARHGENGLSPEEARRKARGVLSRVWDGADPAAERAQARQALALDTLFVEFLRATAARRKASTARLYRSYWLKHICGDPRVLGDNRSIESLGRLGSKRAQDVTHANVLKLHQAIGEGHPTTANRVVTLIAALYTWASKAGHVPKDMNPALEIDRFGESARERYLTADELARLGEVIRLAETKGFEWTLDPLKKVKHSPRPENRRVQISAETASALRLLIFTGARLREILHLRWDSIDLERGTATLEDSKTGRKTIVLNAPAIAVLKQLPRVGPFVIPGDDPSKPRSDLNRPWMLVRERAELDHVRLHDLRHTHAATGAGAGLGLPVIGKILGHKNVATTARYAHLADDPLRRASNTIGDALANAMGDVPAKERRAERPLQTKPVA